jgi:FMN phosphatase YigB (HAD superfamily)
MAKLALFDLDGTLSDDSARQHLYLEKRYKEYFSYEAQMSDPTYQQGRALFYQMVDEGWDIGYLSARLERNRDASRDWLTRERYPHPERAMLRPEEMSDTRPPEFKSHIIGEIIRSGEFEKVVLVDNDPRVVERITADHGEEHVFFADWDVNHKVTASIGSTED